MFYGIVVLIAAGWLIIPTFILHTRNFISALIFKVVPFTIGMFCLYVGLKLIGFI
jgi:hypothetical protein